MRARRGLSHRHPAHAIQPPCLQGVRGRVRRRGDPDVQALWSSSNGCEGGSSHADTRDSLPAGAWSAPAGGRGGIRPWPRVWGGDANPWERGLVFRSGMDGPDREAGRFGADAAQHDQLRPDRGSSDIRLASHRAGHDRRHADGAHDGHDVWKPRRGGPCRVAFSAAACPRRGALRVNGVRRRNGASSGQASRHAYRAVGISHGIHRICVTGSLFLGWRRLPAARSGRGRPVRRREIVTPPSMVIVRRR